MGQKFLEFPGSGTGMASSSRRTLSLAILLSVYAGSAFAAPQYETLMKFSCNQTAPAKCAPNWLTPDTKEAFFYGESGYCGAYAAGTLIKLEPPLPGKTSWRYTTLYTFNPGPYPHRALGPAGGLTLDPTSGALYGVTEHGGLYNQSGSNSLGTGTVFKLTPNDGEFTFSVLHDFNGLDGSYPAIAPILSPAGNLVGSTPSGGFGFGSGKKDTDTGVVFSLAPSAQGRWQQKAVDRFPTPRRGETPAGRLLSDTSGNIFGVTQSGGAYGAGTVYMVSASAPGVRTIIYQFRGTGPIPGKTGRFHDGATPVAGLVADAAGTLYGTTAEGGTGTEQRAGDGTIYMLKKNSSNVWKETVLHNFGTSPTDGSGAGPELVLIKGVLYGTSPNGGSDSSQWGTIFSLTPPSDGETTWTYQILHNFHGATEGQPQQAPLVSDAKGNLYGLTAGPGRTTGVCGEFFKLTP